MLRGTVFAASGLVFAVFLTFWRQNWLRRRFATMEEREPLAAEAAASTEKSKASIAFLGNSIIYYNDTPRLLEALGGGAIVQDSCLRGGVTLGQLLDRGNGMQAKFVSDDKGSPDVASLLSRAWDFVVMNDYTQAPAREVSRNATVEVLTTRLAPLIAQSGATPILLETWAYRAHTKGSDDLGDTAAFTEALRAGYRVYADALAAVLPPQQQPRVHARPPSRAVFCCALSSRCWRHTPRASLSSS